MEVWILFCKEDVCDDKKDYQGRIFKEKKAFVSMDYK